MQDSVKSVIRVRELRHSLTAGARAATALLDAMIHADTAPRAEEIMIDGAAPVLPIGRSISMLVWNVQFCAGRESLFFYDGGEAVHVPEHRTRATIEEVADTLRTFDADIVMLQEVDRNSDRTSRIDQHAELLTRLSYPYHVSTPYYQNRYVPYPTHQHLGRVDMHLSIFSRFAIRSAVRHPLTDLHESWIRRQFNLRRAVLEVGLPLSDGRRLSLMNTHLAAFSRGDGTLPAQIAAVADRVDDAQLRNEIAIVGGDFNALPPGDDPSRLGSDADLYRDEGWPISLLFDRLQSAVPAEAHEDEPERWRTWLPHGEETAQRALDHVFATPGIELLDTMVASGVHHLSDHLPIRLEYSISPL